LLQNVVQQVMKWRPTSSENVPNIVLAILILDFIHNVFFKAVWRLEDGATCK